MKWIFRYLRGSSKSCLSFGSSKPILEGYTDANMAGDLDGRKSTSRYLFMNVHLVYKTLVNVQTPNYKITNTSLYSNNICIE